MFFILFLILSAVVSGQEEVMLKVRDDLTTFSAVETYVLQTGNVYWGEKALGTLFGASIKKEGENLVILCKDTLCVPFYKDDPQNVVIERKGKSFLMAPKVAEAFGYKRLEWDKPAQEIRLYKTPKPALDKANPIPLMDLFLPDTSGQITFLSKYKGKKLIILIWAPWDKGRESLPAWNRLLGELKERCQYVFIAETMEGRERVEPYLSVLKPRPICLVDAGFKAALYYQLKEIPALLLVDEKGNLVSGPLSAKAEDALVREAISLWAKDDASAEILQKGPAIQSYPGSLDLEEAVKRLELSQIIWISGNKEEALAEFNRAVSRFPEHEIFGGQRRALQEPLVVYPPTQTPSQEKPPEP
jgi:hypothetical protein